MVAGWVPGPSPESRFDVMSQGYFLAIAGNIGVGKTELTNRLSTELGWLAYYEPVIHNPYLDPFYADMQRWSFHLQIYFLSERF
jgi:deoxyadenosine/deoxycytidine kinase